MSIEPYPRTTRLSVLLACHRSEVLPRLIHESGHFVASCDLSPAQHDFEHYQCDIREVLYGPWDMIIAFPPCTYLAKVQQWQVAYSNGRAMAQQRAIYLVDDIFNAPCPLVAIENPVGALSRLWRKPSQVIQPFHFGDPYFKPTCFWLKGLPPLISTCVNTVRRSMSIHVNGRMTQNDKARIKSSFDRFPGLCAAIVNQWVVPDWFILPAHCSPVFDQKSLK